MLYGPHALPISWSHMPHIPIVAPTSNIPHNNIGVPTWLPDLTSVYQLIELVQRLFFYHGAVLKCYITSGS